MPPVPKLPPASVAPAKFLPRTCIPRRAPPPPRPLLIRSRRHPSHASARVFTTCVALRSPAAESPDPPPGLDEAEQRIFEKLRSALAPTKLQVQDISGGCGSMYGVEVVSPKFEGLSVVRQHKMVNQVLAEDIRGWHGMQLKTSAPA